MADSIFNDSKLVPNNTNRITNNFNCIVCFYGTDAFELDSDHFKRYKLLLYFEPLYQGLMTIL